MSDSTTNTLSVDLLEGAAHLCLRAAVLARLQEFPPGSSDFFARRWHERRERFENAMKMLSTGVVEVKELGLSSEDFKWAADQADRAKDKEDWRKRFESAAEVMKEDLHGRRT